MQSSPLASSGRTSPSGQMDDSMPNEHLVGSDYVVGTTVKSPKGDTIGSIDKVMIDKTTGKVAYAVISFGGFLGLGQSHYPIPWSMLRYNTENDAYETDLTEDQLRDAPAIRTGDDSIWRDRQYGSQVHDYYGAAPYWTM
jgi:hypothetical protein